MNKKNYRDFLLSNIKPSEPANGGSHVACRCFYCPDGKSPNSKHFYISIPEDDKTPSLYYCHKCHSSGIVTYKTLLEWGIYDPQIGEELVYHNQNCTKYSSNNRYFDDDIVYNIYNDIISQDNNSLLKLKYINDRLGTSLGFEDLIRLKIVLNINDLLKRNKITNLTRHQSIVEQLDRNFLGFLSIDNGFLNMRRICDKGLVYKSIDKRYINYNIFNKFNTSNRFYTIPTEPINLNSPDRLKIHIAEGPFDILSIYLNMRNREKGIYTSIAGSNYLGIVSYFIGKFKLPYSEFHFYPDNDKSGSRYKMEQLRNYLQPLNCPIYIHRNQYPNQKDFGVCRDLMSESIERIF